MLRQPTDELVIRPRLSGVSRMAYVVLALLVVAGASFAGYWGGREAVQEQLDSRALKIESLQRELNDSRELRRRLEVQLGAVQKELSATRGQLERTKSSLTKVTRQLQIDESAYRELRKELEASSRQITELAGELRFYRSIISPADGRSGVRIQDFRVRATGREGEYRYRLILIQALEHEQNVQGTVRFEINGSSGGGAGRTIRSPDESEQPISADFKYFQNFVGTFQLPADFMPAEVRVVFEADNDAVVERMYAWPERRDPQASSARDVEKSTSAAPGRLQVTAGAVPSMVRTRQRQMIYNTLALFIH